MLPNRIIRANNRVNLSDDKIRNKSYMPWSKVQNRSPSISDFFLAFLVLENLDWPTKYPKMMLKVPCAISVVKAL